MPSYVKPDVCNNCAGEHEGPLCVYICPNDLMAINPDTNQVFNQEPQLCSECYACVKICAEDAMYVRGYSDFIPLGASVHPRRVPNGLTWTVTFRNGKVLEFTYPSRSRTAGTVEPYQNFTEDPAADLKGQGLAGESLWLGVEQLPTLSANN